MGTISLGVDLAKCVFAVCEMDAAGRVVRRREFKRDAFALHGRHAVEVQAFASQLQASIGDVDSDDLFELLLLKKLTYKASFAAP